MVNFLYNDCKCDKNAKGSTNVTPMFLALISGRKEILDILQREQTTQEEEESTQAVSTKYWFCIVFAIASKF